MRKTNLERLLDRQPNGIFVAPCESGEIGPALYGQACIMGLEGTTGRNDPSATPARMSRIIGFICAAVAFQSAMPRMSSSFIMATREFTVISPRLPITMIRPYFAGGAKSKPVQVVAKGQKTTSRASRLLLSKLARSASRT
jgi:hypothetical protein